MQQTILEHLDQEVDWTFRGANTQEYTHGIHPYPARMCPQIARRLISNYSNRGDTIFDPFCGSGTVLVEAKLAGRNGVGIDLNPFGILLSKVKTTPIEPQILRNATRHLLRDVEDVIYLSRREPLEIDIPHFFNIEYWFKDYVIRELAIVRDCIMKIDDKDIRDFLLVCFSLLVRKVSNTKNGEFKLYRRPKEQLELYNPNVPATLRQIIKNAVKCMTRFYNKCDKTVDTQLYECDTRCIPLDDEIMDLLVTSPPYGDSRTTVAYGQFSRLPLQWLEYEQSVATTIDRKCLGGSNSREHNGDMRSNTLDKIIDEIASKNTERAKEVKLFFHDLNECYSEMYRLMKPDSYTCIVLGNRTVKKIRIPTDVITIELCENMGFSFIENIARDIPYKTMPNKNAPSNIVGDIVATMSNENIVILKK